MSILRSIFTLLCLGVAVAAAAKAANPPAPAPSVVDTCLMCHSAADAKGAGGKSIAVDGAKFASSVHGEMKLKCTDCHADVSADKLPHPEKLKPVNCATCHDKAVNEYAGTVHGVARKGGQHRRRDVHRLPREARHQAREGPRFAHQSRERRGDLLEVPRQRRRRREGQAARRQHRRASSTTASTARRSRAPRRGRRRPAPIATARTTSAPRATRKAHELAARVPDTCGTCHKPEREAYGKGMHGKLRQEGVLAAPGCTDCH